MSRYEDKLIATGEREQILKYLRTTLQVYETMWDEKKHVIGLGPSLYTSSELVRRLIADIEQGKHLERT